MGTTEFSELSQLQLYREIIGEISIVITDLS